jgi:hypothetical protein
MVAAIHKLAGLIRAHSPYDGCFELRIPGVYIGQAIANIINAFPPALQVHHLNEPLAVPEGNAPSGGETSHVVHDDGSEYCELARWASERFTVQQRIRPLLRELSDQGHRQADGTGICCS